MFISLIKMKTRNILLAYEGEIEWVGSTHNYLSPPQTQDIRNAAVNTTQINSQYL